MAGNRNFLFGSDTPYFGERVNEWVSAPRDARIFMFKYLHGIALCLDTPQQEKAGNLVSAINLCVGRLQTRNDKRPILRELRRADLEYHLAWKALYADPQVFVRRHPGLKEFRQVIPPWLLDSMYETARVCPKCNLTNSASTERCDCGSTLTERDCPNFR